MMLKWSDMSVLSYVYIYSVCTSILYVYQTYMLTQNYSCVGVELYTYIHTYIYVRHTCLPTTIHVAEMKRHVGVELCIHIVCVYIYIICMSDIHAYPKLFMLLKWSDMSVLRTRKIMVARILASWSLGKFWVVNTWMLWSVINIPYVCVCGVAYILTR